MADLITTEGKQLQVKGMDAITIFRQLLAILAMAASVAIGIWAAVFWGSEPNYSVLSSSLDEQEVGLIMEALQKDGVAYKVDEGSGALLVPSKDLQSVKIKLAAQGLPKSSAGALGGAAGNSDFFISDSAEKERIKRKMELDIARTISSIDNVKSARVHIALPTRRLFVRDKRKPSAAVVVNLYAGRELTQGQVSAIAHMVSSSVPELSFGDVTVVDQSGKLLTQGDSDNEIGMSSSQFDYAKKVEQSYIQRIENILIPVVGADAIRAQVTVDLDFTFSEQTQESFNPDNPVARSVDSSEESATGNLSGGAPGAVSNSPPAKASAPEKSPPKEDKTASEPKAAKSSRHEIKNYELDKTVSVTRFQMGRLKRLSAAVVIDDIITRDEAGAIIRTDRSPEELQRINELVKKAIGFNVQRGDTVNVVNVAFATPATPEPLPEPPLWEKPWVWDVAKQITGGLILLFVVLVVLKPAIKNFSKSLAPIIQMPSAPALSEGGDNQTQALAGGGADQRRLENSHLSPFDRNMQNAMEAARSDPKLVAQVVKNWVAEDG